MGLCRCRKRQCRGSDCRPTKGVVFVVLLTLYFFVVSGIVYDVVKEPATFGSSLDPRTGRVRMHTFMWGRVHGQYVFEGLIAGFMICIAGCGLILFDVALTAKRISPTWQVTGMALGLGALLVGHAVVVSFFTTKMPQYMAT